jgi:hypothetical protein
VIYHSFPEMKHIQSTEISCSGLSQQMIKNVSVVFMYDQPVTAHQLQTYVLILQFNHTDILKGDILKLRSQSADYHCKVSKCKSKIESFDIFMAMMFPI